MVSDLLTIFARMEIVREHLGRRLGISAPQYSLIVAIAHLQGASGIGVGALAQALHVSSAFVASETGKLARRGFLLKRTNPLDRRGVLLSIAPAGRLKLDRISAEIRKVNDLFFGALDGKGFAALSGMAAGLVESSADALRSLNRLKGIAAGCVAGHRAEERMCAVAEIGAPAAKCRPKRACGIRPVCQRSDVM